MTKKLVLASICFLPFQLLAQQTWNLKTCIEYGLKNSLNSVVYENDKKAADAVAKELLSDYLPKVTVNAGIDNNLRVQQSVIPAGIFGPEPVRVAFSQKYNGTGQAQVDQTIYDQALLTGLKANKLNKAQASINVVKGEETIIYNIGVAYYQIYVYREQLKLLRENVGTYLRQVDISRLQVEKGVTLKKDLDKVTVDYNNALSQIRIAQSNLMLSENQLKYEMGYPINSPLPVDSVSQRDVDVEIADNQLNDTFLAENRTDFQLSTIESKLLDIDLKRIRAGALPKLTAYARYGAVGFGNSLGPVFRELSPFSVVGVKLSIPLFDFFKRNAQYNQAKYKSLNAAVNLKLDASKYQLEFENAKTKLNNARTNLESDSRNIDLAKSVFATTDFQYKKGVTDLTDWITAQNSIKESQNNYLNSLFNFYQAKLDLDKASGKLKSFYTSL